MILDKEVSITLDNTNLDYFENLGYSNKLGDIINVNIEHLPLHSNTKVKVKCDICGKENNITINCYNRNIKNGGYYSCQKCSNIKAKKTNLEKYGVECALQSIESKEKTKKTNLEKYGNEIPMLSKQIQEKFKKSCLEKFGVENPFQSNEIKEKIKEINLEKYGVENPFQSEEIKEKIKLKMLELYGKNHNSKIQSVKDIKKKKLQEYYLTIFKNDDLFISYDFDNKEYTLKCDCGKDHEFKIDRTLLKNRKKLKTQLCTICNIQGNCSGLESKLLEYIKNIYSGEILTNKRTTLDNEFELDIYLPKLKLAIEFNGIYWHNEINKPNDYHLKKLNYCNKKGIKLLQIWEDDWLFKQDIIKSMILNKLNLIKNKIYARHCKLIEIKETNIIKDFLNRNHLQGYVDSKINLGLYYKNELISLMTFGNKRLFMNSKSEIGEFELLRYCNKLNTNVIGGASKLFNFFIKNYNYKEIITYADKCFSDGNLYKILGFNFIKDTQPNYYYVVNGIRKHRFGFRKDKLVKEGYDKNKSEHEIMMERKIYRIYDCGNLKFSIKN